jgi:hypothetical protein
MLPSVFMGIEIRRIPASLRLPDLIREHDKEKMLELPDLIR